MFDEKFWLAISFFIFAGLFAKYVLPIILRMIDSSASKVADDIKNAENLKKDAEKMLVEAKKYYQDTLKYCDQLIVDTKSEIKSLQEKTKSELELEIKLKMDAAVARVKTQEERTIREIKQGLVNDALDKVKQDLANSPKNVNDNFVTQSISDISKL